MIYNLLTPFADDFFLFNLARYHTFRAGAACMTALLISLVFGSSIIRWLRSFQRGGQPIRDDGPERHLIEKKGTPTMGGVMILLALVVSTLLWADLRSGMVWAVLLVTVGYGALGFADDWLKVTKRNTRGVSGRAKLFVQAGLGLVAALWITALMPGPLGDRLAVPFFKEVLVPFGLLFPLFGMLVMMGSSNAVNLTDGLDGLATMPVIIASVAFMLIVYLAGNVKFADYLGIPHVARAGDLAIFCGAKIGAGLAFLWYNAPPAAVFMGDTGSLALGGALGTIAVVAHHEIVLGIIGGLFVVEAMSVIIQVFWYKRTGRRVFRMAPIHHHFEQLGWSEPTVVIRFWIISLVLALAGLSTLKLR